MKRLRLEELKSLFSLASLIKINRAHIASFYLTLNIFHVNIRVQNNLWEKDVRGGGTLGILNLTF